MIRPRTAVARRIRLMLAGMVALLVAGCSGCGQVTPDHSAVGRSVPSLPLVSLADRSRPPPSLAGRVTLLNFFGTWCLPCRRELPGLARLAARLQEQPAFQLVAVSCGTAVTEDVDRLAAVTEEFLAGQRLTIDAWADPDGFARRLFHDAYGFDSYPSTYLIGPNARILATWRGYRPQDEADMARAVVAALKELAPPAPTGAATPAPEPAVR